MLGMIDERGGYRRAVPAQAQVVAGKSFIQSTGHHRYTFFCTFVDHLGRRQDAWFSLLADRLPVAIRRGIDSGKLPTNFRVLFDPDWPGRNWPAHLAYSDDGRLHLYSILNILFSAPLTGLVALLSRKVNMLPPPEVIPFYSGLWVLFFAGMVQGW